MNWRCLCSVLFVTANILVIGAAFQATSAGATADKDIQLKPLELIGGASAASEPDAMVFRCSGSGCGTYNELVYWGIDNKIYFLDANSLTSTASPLNAPFNSLPGSRYLFFDRNFSQIYALLKSSEGYYPDTWSRVDVGIIRDYDYAWSVPVNEVHNTPQPVDRYYHIDGAAMSNSGSRSSIYIDNPVYGIVDVVTFDGNNPEITAQSSRFSYRAPLACSTQQYCNWHSNSGSSLAVDKYGNVYIADNNDFVDKIVVRGPGGSAKPSINNVGSWFPCFVDEAGLSMAPAKNILYLPNGCQSFENGALAQYDLLTGNHNVITLPYNDQDMIVDMSDQKRVFIATTDYFDGENEYDKENRLLLHLLYDGKLIFTLPVMKDYKKRSLTAMAFDSNANILYLAVEKTIYKVKVNYPSPQLPSWQSIIAPISILLY